jgi:hypothetical protein
MGFAENLGVIINMKDGNQRWMATTIAGSPSNPDNRCIKQAVPRTSALQHAAQLSSVERSYSPSIRASPAAAIKAVCAEVLERVAAANAQTTRLVRRPARPRRSLASLVVIALPGRRCGGPSAERVRQCPPRSSIPPSSATPSARRPCARSSPTRRRRPLRRGGGGAGAVEGRLGVIPKDAADTIAKRADAKSIDLAR